ncbi:hypothetical protein [Vallitalea guaymasensis]|uniref:Uncharacterized protein n=1 Tax=Vallitalea guaymasensis TaxID=1185412 RepID=A0A8J8M8Y8_9FIRM|nr:hypothetical protein [Vallitalea guaymasensis]QUH28542.1 hypothetical protein HYG85_06225 [Vallitalea guaymasensis]
MGFIAILLAVFNIIIMFLRRVYLHPDTISFLVFVLIIINIVYLVVLRKISGVYGVLKKWFKGDKLEIDEWNILLVNTRQLLVVNYILSFIIWIVIFICNIIGIRIPLGFATSSLQIVILFNGIILAPGYIQIQRKVK